MRNILESSKKEIKDELGKHSYSSGKQKSIRKNALYYINNDIEFDEFFYPFYLLAIDNNDRIAQVMKYKSEDDAISSFSKIEQKEFKNVKFIGLINDYTHDIKLYLYDALNDRTIGL